MKQRARRRPSTGVLGTRSPARPWVRTRREARGPSLLSALILSGRRTRPGLSFLVGTTRWANAGLDEAPAGPVLPRIQDGSGALRGQGASAEETSPVPFLPPAGGGAPTAPLSHTWKHHLEGTPGLGHGSCRCACCIGLESPASGVAPRARGEQNVPERHLPPGRRTPHSAVASLPKGQGGRWTAVPGRTAVRDLDARASEHGPPLPEGM